MKFTIQHLQKAVEENILSAEQSQQFIQFLKQQTDIQPSFNIINVLYYLGGLIAIGAMTLFMGLAWEEFGGAGIFFISLLYAGIAIKFVHTFQNKQLIIPAGICATFVVALTPLAIYGLQNALDFWPQGSAYKDYHRDISWHWLFMELGTLAAGAIMLWKYRFPFLVMPIAVTLWYLTMDLAPVIFEKGYSWDVKHIVSMYTGLLMTLLAFWVDVRSRYKADYAFWIYLFGVVAFWFGLSRQTADDELTIFFYFLINLAMIFIGVILLRKIFVVFGALGCTFYVGYLSAVVFKDSILFPVSLTILGAIVIYLGVLWQKHEQTIASKLRSILPSALNELIASKQY